MIFWQHWQQKCCSVPSYFSIYCTAYFPKLMFGFDTIGSLNSPPSWHEYRSLSFTCPKHFFYILCTQPLCSITWAFHTNIGNVALPLLPENTTNDPRAAGLGSERRIGAKPDKSRVLRLNFPDSATNSYVYNCIHPSHPTRLLKGTLILLSQYYLRQTVLPYTRAKGEDVRKGVRGGTGGGVFTPNTPSRWRGTNKLRSLSLALTYPKLCKILTRYPLPYSLQLYIAIQTSSTFALQTLVVCYAARIRITNFSCFKV